MTACTAAAAARPGLDDRCQSNARTFLNHLPATTCGECPDVFGLHGVLGIVARANAYPYTYNVINRAERVSACARRAVRARERRRYARRGGRRETARFAPTKQTVVGARNLRARPLPLHAYPPEAPETRIRDSGLWPSRDCPRSG